MSLLSVYKHFTQGVSSKIVMSLVVLMMLVCTACETEPAEQRGNVTKRGKLLYDEWDRFFSSHVVDDWFDMAFRMNTYYEAADSQKNMIEDSLLVAYKIRQCDSVWELRINNSVYYRFTFDKPLSVVGAEWVCERMPIAAYAYDYGFYDLTITYRIACVGQNTWRLVIDDERIAPLSADILIETDLMPKETNNMIYSMLGTAVFQLPIVTYGYDVFVKFATSYPLRHTKYQWSSGNLDLVAFDFSGNELPVDAEISQNEQKISTVAITYCGVTETYKL